MQHAIARDVINNPCCSPVVASTFSPQDASVFSYVRLAGNFVGHYMRWEYYTPQGKLYDSFEGAAQFDNHWTSIAIANQPAASQLGQWTVKFYIDGALQFQDNFTIADTSSQSVTVNLASGWHIVPYLGQTQAVGDALAAINGKYSVVYGLKAQQQDWDSHDPNAPPLPERVATALAVLHLHDPDDPSRVADLRGGYAAKSAADVV